MRGRANSLGPDAKPPRALSKRTLAQMSAWVGLGAAIVGGIAIAGNMHSGAAVTRASSVSATSVPSISGSDPMTGRHIALAQFAGKPVLINIWASWCPGCNQEARSLSRFAAAHPGVQVLGIDIEDTVGGARAFYRKWDVPYPSISDPDGTLTAELSATGVPTTVFLDARHHVVDRLLGAGGATDFEAGMRAINRGRRA
jgi:cytochrome c biogenesis protein CcmG, thiol:disulfide interchange protein DsbE